MNNFEVLALFPTPLYISFCDIDIQESVKIFETCKLQTVEQQWQNDYGLRSENTYVLDQEKCNLLRLWILEHVKNFAQKLLNFENLDFAITQSWVSIKSKGQRHTAHRHPNSIISGVFYWEEYEQMPIIFHKPEATGTYSSLKMTTLPGKNNFPYSWDSYAVSPKKNSLILFPSHLKHSVDSLQTDTIRKCLAFNVMPKKIIGNNGGLDELDFQRLI
jgi:uncharacterized protein (TIGR02466 family)